MLGFNKKTLVVFSFVVFTILLRRNLSNVLNFANIYTNGLLNDR